MTGVEGNEKLTAMTGAILLLGFAVEGFTILSIHSLIVMHFVVGFLLIGPVVLKVASTGYRFARYYTGSRPYLRKGPPAPILRVLGPLVILTSLAVLGTGVMLAVVGPGHGGPWLFLHKATFVLWFGAMTIHVLSYAPKLPQDAVRAAAGQRPAGAGRTGPLAGADRGAGGRRRRRRGDHAHVRQLERLLRRVPLTGPALGPAEGALLGVPVHDPDDEAACRTAGSSSASLRARSTDPAWYRQMPAISSSPSIGPATRRYPAARILSK